MHTDQIYIARDGKSGMHVLVRILAVDDIGVDYPPIDPDNFNKLMMARDVNRLPWLHAISDPCTFQQTSSHVALLYLAISSKILSAGLISFHPI